MPKAKKVECSGGPAVPAAPDLPGDTEVAQDPEGFDEPEADEVDSEDAVHGGYQDSSDSDSGPEDRELVIQHSPPPTT
eukprot:8378623-Pyramimonas_sp.AAC.1